jgi:6-pyruvoyltetrahydropterin/6-carboxytetrahydropterin synthase
MIATIAKRFTFDAAHRLDRLPATHKCHRMHGHTYEVELVFTGMVDEDGFVIDYSDIAEMWYPLHDQLDHRVLNEVPGLEIPSTEHLAGWIACHLCRKLTTEGPGMIRIFDTVKVKESTTTWCSVTVASLTDDDFNRYTRR